jgi:DNA-directed RNA polymerase specialized sigma24 family protein
MSDDSVPFDPDDDEMLGRLLNRLRRFAIYWCHNDVEAAEEVVQEASLRLHLGKTHRQLTKFKGKVYDAIPRELLFRLFHRIRNKK